MTKLTASERRQRQQEEEARWLQPPYLPLETSQIERAFPAHFERLMVAPERIPATFWRGREGYQPSTFTGLTMTWMMGRWPEGVAYAPMPDVDAETAFWHLHCIIGSYGPKHEHKEACVEFLAERWFQGIGVRGQSAIYGLDIPAVDDSDVEDVKDEVEDAD